MPAGRHRAQNRLDQTRIRRLLRRQDYGAIRKEGVRWGNPGFTRVQRRSPGRCAAQRLLAAAPEPPAALAVERLYQRVFGLFERGLLALGLAGCEEVLKLNRELA